MDEKKMTPQQAVDILSLYDINFYDGEGNRVPAQDLITAFDMAMNALQTLEDLQKFIDTYIDDHADSGDPYDIGRHDGACDIGNYLIKQMEEL